MKFLCFVLQFWLDPQKKIISQLKGNSGADICRICRELCVFGLKASNLVKMLPFLH